MLFMLVAAALAGAPPTRPAPPARAGVTYRIPYRVTATNHLLVRAKINGAGPYNFILDSGAPALFIPTSCAKDLGITPDKNKFGTVKRLEIEGGAVVDNVLARIEDPYQMTAMNQLALTGTRIDGIIGYNVLARFRTEIDLTQPTLGLTRVAFNPGVPFLMTRADQKKVAQPTQNLKQMESMAKMASAMFARKPQTVVTRGFFGFTLDTRASGAVVQSVLPGSPAADAGLAAGDTILETRRAGAQAGEAIQSTDDLRKALERVAAGEKATLKVKRGEATVTLDVTAGKGA